MYKRYSSCPPNPQSNRPTNTIHQKPPAPEKKEKHEAKSKVENHTTKTTENPFLKFIPQSIYNQQTGKVLGILNTDDLFLIALILLLLDNDDEDNSMLIIALIYILLSEHIDLPF